MFMIILLYLVLSFLGLFHLVLSYLVLSHTKPYKHKYILTILSQHCMILTQYLRSHCHSVKVWTLEKCAATFLMIFRLLFLSNPSRIRKSILPKSGRVLPNILPQIIKNHPESARNLIQIMSNWVQLALWDCLAPQRPQKRKQ